MSDLKIKEISGFVENGVEKTKIVFAESDKDTEIIFEGSGAIKVPVEA